MSAVYNIHFNGDTPYDVEVDAKENEVRIYHERGSSVFLFDQFYPGEDHYQVSPDEETPRGVNCLYVRNGVYTFIGKEVFSFSLKENDTFVRFCSYLGPNDVPYSYLIGTHYVYLFTTDRTKLIALPVSSLFGEDTDYHTDPYEILYEDDTLEPRSYIILTTPVL